MTLDEEDIEAIVEGLLEAVPALRTAQSKSLVDATRVAAELGVSRAAVWRNAKQLGGVQVGAGTRPRWRFDLETARRANEHTAPSPSAQPPRRRSRQSTVPLLPIRG